MTKVIHISTSARAGGAARASYRLHQGLMNLGFDSKVFAQIVEGDEENAIRFKPARDIFTRIKRSRYNKEEQSKK